MSQTERTESQASRAAAGAGPGRTLAMVTAAGAALPILTVAAGAVWLHKAAQAGGSAVHPISLTAGVAALAAVCVAAWLVVLRQGARVIRPLLAIRSAMRSMAAGERSLEALAISPRWGPEAAAWNAFLAGKRAEGLRDVEGPRDGAGAGRPGTGLLDRACDWLHQGLVALDGAGRVRYANGAAASALGLDRREMAGKLFSSLVGDERAAAVIRSVAEQGARRRASVEIRRGSGDEASVLRLTCSRGGTGTEAGAPTGVLVEDLTQQRIADQARDLFVAHATHELRTPLTNIRLYLETLLEGGDRDATTRGECINVINQEARRLERMVGDMLSVAEIEAGSLKLHTDDVRLEGLLQEVRADFAAQAAEKRIALTFDLPPKLPVIRGDRDKIAMSLHNLIGNALKYTPEDGAVTVEVEETPSAVAIRVKDTGIGIAPEELERVFEKFYRSKDRRVAKVTGTGLGLAIAREVVRLHGGDITLESELNKGSTFTMTLPHTAMAA